MLKKLLFLIFTSLFILFLSTSSMPNPQNPPTANSGAPGETTCMISGCHSGGNFTGTVDITGVPDTVFANQTYDVTITNKSNAVRSGFELTVLDTLNKFTGTLITGTNVSIAKDNSNGRTYARHSAALFLSNGEASWSFQWKAPASASSQSLIFYFVSMCADGNGNNTKDNSIKNTKRVIFQLPVANNDLNSINETSISIQDAKLIIHDAQNRKAEDVLLTNLNGIILFQSGNLPSNSFDIVNSAHGIYLLHFKFGHELHAEKVIIP